MYTAKNSLNEKFSSLDYFRGFAGYGVAICHYYYYIYNLKHFEYLSFFFVEFFFILSGYVLTPQIIKVYNQNKNLKIFFFKTMDENYSIIYISSNFIFHIIQKI